MGDDPEILTAKTPKDAKIRSGSHLGALGVSSSSE
jgi:hypothetical protein